MFIFWGGGRGRGGFKAFNNNVVVIFLHLLYLMSEQKGGDGGYYWNQGPTPAKNKRGR